MDNDLSSSGNTLAALKSTSPLISVFSIWGQIRVNLGLFWGQFGVIISSAVLSIFCPYISSANFCYFFALYK